MRVQDPDPFFFREYKIRIRVIFEGTGSGFGLFSRVGSKSWLNMRVQDPDPGYF